MESIYSKMCSVTVFRNILELPVMDALIKYISAASVKSENVSEYQFISMYCAIYYKLAASDFSTLGEYLDYHLRYDNGPYPKAVCGDKTNTLKAAAERDIDIFTYVTERAYQLKANLISSLSPYLLDSIGEIPDIVGGSISHLSDLEASYKRNGTGAFAMGKAFVWDGKCVSLVSEPDKLTQEEMIGYNWQRQEVIKNTRALIEGKDASNVLLHGNSGTGKSATIKSLIYIPEFYNLRIIEIAREGMANLRDLIQLLSGNKQNFILFIDDLTFSGEDSNYSALKSILEGGLGMRPSNVVVYATSNRRHMIRESFSERSGDDVHTSETIQEKTSLADRFAIRIPYMALHKAEFLLTVENMAKRKGLTISKEELHEKANKWEISHGGRTPRVARQFIDYLASDI